MANTGTYDLATLAANRFQSAAEFGIDKIATVLAQDLAAHNIIMQDLLAEFVEYTTDRQRIYGASLTGDMTQVDEYGRSATQRQLPGSTVGFPLHMFQFAIGWTEKWMQIKTPADVATGITVAKKAHLRNIQKEVKKALMLAANYTHVDYLVDGVTLGAKRLINADSQAIPDGPNAEIYDGATHTHYLARVGGALALSDVLLLVNTVVEHGHGGMVKIAINRADENTWRALTGTNGFQAYVDPRINFRNTDTPNGLLDISRLDNRAIGIIGSAELWVKPWVPAGYSLAWDSSGPKPLCFRERAQDGLRGLRIAATNSTFPLTAQYMESEFGMGVWNRTNGAVLYAGGVTYVDPTI